MAEIQTYELLIKDLFVVSGGIVSGTEAEVAILDGAVEIDRLKFSGKVGPYGSGYRQLYEGKLGLTAKLASGACKIRFRKAVATDINLEV